jgi:hypothetical protein
LIGDGRRFCIKRDCKIGRHEKQKFEAFEPGFFLPGGASAVWTSPSIPMEKLPASFQIVLAEKPRSIHAWRRIIQKINDTDKEVLATADPFDYVEMPGTSVTFYPLETPYKKRGREDLEKEEELPGAAQSESYEEVSSIKIPRLPDDWRTDNAEAINQVLLAWNDVAQLVEMLQTASQALQEDSFERDRLLEELDKRVFDVHARV